MNAQITSQNSGLSNRGAISLADAVALIRTPEQFQGAQSQAPGGETVQPVSPASLTVVVDMPALLSRCLGNLDLVKRVLAKFQVTGTADLRQIEVAIEQSDFATIAKLGHRFKGAAGNISAARLRLLATYIEQSALEQSLAEIQEAFTQAQAEWDAFVQFASGIAQGNVAASANVPPRAQ